MNQVIEEMSEVVGLGLAYEIAIRWSGAELYVPAKIQREHPISLSVGFEAAQKMAAHFGGCRLRMPTEKAILKAKRNEVILAMWLAGQTMKEIADSFGMTRPNVSHILDKFEIDEETRAKRAANDQDAPQCATQERRRTASFAANLAGLRVGELSVPPGIASANDDEAA